MTNLLHKMRRGILSFGISKTADQNFETLKQGFDTLVGLTDTIAKRLDAHVGQLHGLASSNDQFAIAFSAIMQKAAPDNPYVALSNEAKDGAAALSKQDEASKKQLAETAQKRIADLQRAYTEFQKRIKLREEACKNYDYYVNKVKKLHGDRDKLKAGGKAEAPKDVEHREQNEKKLDNATRDYTDLNNALVQDLNHLWEHRFDFLGPVLAEVLAVQLQFSEGFFHIIGNMKITKVEPSVPLEFKSVPNSNSAAPAAAAASPQTPQQPETAAQPAAPVAATNATGSPAEGVQELPPAAFQ